MGGGEPYLISMIGMVGVVDNVVKVLESGLVKGARRIRRSWRDLWDEEWFLISSTEEVLELLEAIAQLLLDRHGCLIGSALCCSAPRGDG